MPWTVTNSFKRGLMRTYGRSLWHPFNGDDHQTAKRRCVETEDDGSDEAESSIQYAIRDSAAIFSSPSRQNLNLALSSDDPHGHELSTPPSSPPRLSPPVNTHKPTFSFLKRKNSSIKETSNGPPLTEVNSNSMRSSTNPPKKKAQKRPVLKQMQIDLGNDVRKNCPACGMEYVPSNSEDAALHKKFHDMNYSGVDLGRAFMKTNASRWVYEATRFDGGYVVIVDRKASPTAKNQANKVLEVVNKELSSPEIPDDVVWSQTEPPKHLQRNGSMEKNDRYKVFLHMKDSRCVGLCLAERIWESRPVERPSTERNGTSQLNNSSSISVQDKTNSAIVGIARIWTSGSSRRKGIAMDLLDCVVNNYIYGMEIPKDQVAFSQPTESGKLLAESFFGPGEQWHVYDDG